MEAKQRNWRFDYLKGIACIIVILLHVPLPGAIGDGIIYSCRFSVPIFFMITGYYTEKRDNKWILKKIRQLLTKLLIAELLYGIWKLLFHIVMDGKTVAEFFEDWGFIKHPVKVIFCGSFFNGVFWYIYALIWAYVLVIVLRKIKWIYNNLFCIIATLFLVALLVVGRFVMQNMVEIDEYTFLFCNALVFALPMMMTGMLFARKEEDIKEKISLGKNVLLLFIGGTVLVAEYIFSRQYMDFHFSTLIISSSVFMFAFVYNKESILCKKPLSFIGQNLSLWIYLDHIFVNNLCRVLAFYICILDNKIYGYLHPFIVIALSIVMAYMIYRIKSHGLKKYNKINNRGQKQYETQT